MSNHPPQYLSFEAIEDALAHDEASAQLVTWLSASYLHPVSNSISSENHHGGGLTRGRAAVLILNAIREACQPFLSIHPSASGRNASISTPGSTPQKSPPPHMNKEQTYEEAFPSLSVSGKAQRMASAPAVESQHATGASKPKRRIRPAILPSPAGDPNANKGNLVDAPPLLPSSSTENSVPINSPLLDPSVRTNLGAAQPVQTTPSQRKLSLTATPTKNRSPTSKAPSPCSPHQARADHRSREDLGEETDETVSQFLKANSPELERLIRAYCVIVDSCLAPSIALEVHLLIQLLAMPSDSQDSTPGPSFAAVAAVEKEKRTAGIISLTLSSPPRCRWFGSQALTKLVPVMLGRLGPRRLLVDIARCPPVRLHCPEVVDGIERAIQRSDASKPSSSSEGLNAGSDTSAKQLLMTSRVAHLTVPFHEGRDSRHHFKSRDEQIVYKNREEVRDAFLYQLRTFVSIRGKVVDRQQKLKLLEATKFSFRDIVAKLHPSNLGWFSKRLFRDMLLQIGLVPLEETDSELLKMADHDKLQKLHQRFTNKNPQSMDNKNLRSVASNPNSLDLPSPATEAQPLFPGHQEFFYMFLLAVDSHRLATHVTASLASALLESSAQAGRQGEHVEKRCLEMCMIARFLGVLVFSPNWESITLPAAVRVCSGYNGLDQLSAFGISPVEMIRESYCSHRLVAVVPWVVEMLKLAKRDPFTKDSRTYRGLVVILREVQLVIATDNLDSAVETQALLVVKLSLEAFFGDMVGISHSPEVLKADISENPRSTLVPKDALDEMNLSLSSQNLIVINEHVHELSELISQLSRSDLGSIRSPGATRKLRPSSLESPVAGKLPPLPDVPSTGQASSTGVSLVGTESTFQSKLQDSFFHQHPELREVCEFFAGRLLKVVLYHLALEDILLSLSIQSRSEAYTVFESFVAKKLKECMRHTITSSVVRPGDKNVIDVAVALTVALVLRSNEEDLKAKVNAHYDRMEKELAVRPKRSIGKAVSEMKIAAGERFQALTAAIHALISQVEASEMSQVRTDSFDAVVSRLEDIDLAQNRYIPADNELRVLYQSVLSLDRLSSKVLSWALDPNSEVPAAKRWSVLNSYLRVAIKIKGVSIHGLRGVYQGVGDVSTLTALLRLGVRESHGEQLSSVLHDMTCERIITARILRSVQEATDDEATRNFLSDFEKNPSTTL